MKLLTLWNAKQAWATLSMLRKQPKVAYRLMKYERALNAEMETIERARTEFILKAANAEPGATVTLDVGTPELAAFNADFNAFLNTDCDLRPVGMDMDALIDVLDSQAGNVLSEAELMALEPFFVELPALAAVA